MANTPEIGEVPPDFTVPGTELTGAGVSESEYPLPEAGLAGTT